MLGADLVREKLKDLRAKGTSITCPVAIRGGRIYFMARKAGLAVSVDVALNEPLIEVSG